MAGKLEHLNVTELINRYNECMKVRIECLKDKQLETIEALRRGDVLAILPTGYGKSLKYHLLPFIEDCIVIVLCPLNSILYEQKERLGENALLVDKRLMSDLKFRLPSVIQQCSGYSYILSTPENMLTPEFNNIFQQPLFQDDKRKIYIIVDECHCVVQWGNNFRPKYKEIYELRCSLSKSHFWP